MDEARQDFNNIYTLYSSCKTAHEREKPRFDSISKYAGLELQPDYKYSTDNSKKDNLDEYIDDPTAALSINQSGDYLIGIMWGSGDNVFTLKPTKHVTDQIDEEAVKPFYQFATEQVLYHMNHEESGYATALRPYAYEQQSYGTSGIGIFPNKSYLNGQADNALIAMNYGIDNTVIDEGKSGVVDVVFATYRWKVNRIIGEFCKTKGTIDNKKMAKLPLDIRNAYTSGDYNKEFVIVQGVFPREDYSPKLRGKRGTKYRGVWFMDESSPTNDFFYEEDFKERPINMARAIKVRGSAYGRSSGTLLMSTIRAVNHMVGQVIEVIEKMNDPSLGMWNNAIFGDNVLDSSSGGMTVFNQMLLGGADKPVFPLYDVGDPSALIQFLIPYLNEKIATAFKVDILLDFSSAKAMTATESMQRYTIRGRSLSSMLLLQKNERLVPDVKRSTSILYDMGELGVNPRTMTEAAEKLKLLKKPERIIPDAVLNVIESGRAWYKIEWNNELEKLTRTEKVQALIQVLNAITAIAALNPDIIKAVNWYQLLKDINDNLDSTNQILLTEEEFKAQIAAAAEERAAIMALQAGQAGAAMQKDTSQANKNNQEAISAR